MLNHMVALFLVFCSSSFLAVCCHPVLFNLYAEYIMRNARLDQLQATIKIGGRNINNLRYVDAATKSRQSCPTLCDPIDGSPPGSCPWDSPGKNIGGVAISFSDMWMIPP